MMRMAEKVVVVTGAAGGIGRAIVELFAAEGASVFAADLAPYSCEPRGDATASSVCRVEVDVTDDASVEQLFAQVMRRHGRLDCAVNNAGVEHPLVGFTDCDGATWSATLQVNLTGSWRCMQWELRQMLAQGSGAIVNVASVAGLGGAPKLGAYAASKHGVVGLTRSAAIEYARRNVRINAVCPSYARTPMLERMIAGDPKLAERFAAASPMGRLCEAREVAEAVLWLGSDAASFVTGHALPVDGGLSAW